jgi:hypothetical protein
MYCEQDTVIGLDQKNVKSKKQKEPENSPKRPFR